jgi:hypothetical protein
MRHHNIVQMLGGLIFKRRSEAHAQSDSCAYGGSSR